MSQRHKGCTEHLHKEQCEAERLPGVVQTQRIPVEIAAAMPARQDRKRKRCGGN